MRQINKKENSYLVKVIMEEIIKYFQHKIVLRGLIISVQSKKLQYNTGHVLKDKINIQF